MSPHCLLRLRVLGLVVVMVTLTVILFRQHDLVALSKFFKNVILSTERQKTSTNHKARQTLNDDGSAGPALQHDLLGRLVRGKESTMNQSNGNELRKFVSGTI